MSTELMNWVVKGMPVVDLIETRYFTKGVCSLSFFCYDMMILE